MACEFKDCTGRWIRANVVAFDPRLDAVQLDVNPGAWQKCSSSRLRPFLRLPITCSPRQDGSLHVHKGGLDPETLKKLQSDRRDVAFPCSGPNEAEASRYGMSRLSSSTTALPIPNTVESVVVMPSSIARCSDKEQVATTSEERAAPVSQDASVAPLAMSPIPGLSHMGAYPSDNVATSLGEKLASTSPTVKRNEALGSTALAFERCATARIRTSSSSPPRTSSPSPRRLSAPAASARNGQMPVPGLASPSEESYSHAETEVQMTLVPELAELQMAKTQVAAPTTTPAQTTRANVVMHAGSSVVVDAGPSIAVDALHVSVTEGANSIGRSVHLNAPDPKIVAPTLVTRLSSNGTRPAGQERSNTPLIQSIANPVALGAGSNMALQTVMGEYASMIHHECSLNENAANTAGSSVVLRLDGKKDLVHTDPHECNMMVSAADIDASKPMAMVPGSSALLRPSGKEWTSGSSNGCSVTVSAPDTMIANPMVLETKQIVRMHPAGSGRASMSPNVPGCSVTISALDTDFKHPFPLMREMQAGNLRAGLVTSQQADHRRQCKAPEPRSYLQQMISPPFQHQQLPIAMPIPLPTSVSLAPAISVPVPLPGVPCATFRSDHLEKVIAPGDVLFTQGNAGYLSNVGAAGGFMGHVSVVISPPISVMQNTPEASLIQEAWPADDVSEVWRVQTAECTRAESGLYQCDTILYVDPSTRRLIIAGDVAELHSYVRVGVSEEPVAVELWQSPPERRSQLNLALMTQVLQEMSDGFANWSMVSAVRAFLFSSSEIPEENMLAEVQECWYRKPICTSVVIMFWQRYLCKLADLSGGVQRAIDLIRECMPVKADRTLPHDLLTAMRETGWTSRSLMPVVA